MYGFIDESGDLGFKFEQGSSMFFTMSLVIFSNKDNLIECNNAISELKIKLGWKENDEFHFKRNSHKIRDKFVKTIARSNFIYYGICINKKSFKLLAGEFKKKEYLYSYTCGLLLEKAQVKLKKINIIIDKTGDPSFQNYLSKYIKGKINKDIKRVNKIKMQRSESTNLLQLTDYIAGIVSRSIISDKYESDEYRKILKNREGGIEMI